MGQVLLFVDVECDSDRHKAKRQDTRKMPIPQFDKRGLLPAGAHVCTLDEFKSWSGSIPNSKHRLMLVEKFERFLAEVVRPIASGWPLVIDGSFVTDKERPNDIDFALDLRNCQDDLLKAGAFFNIHVQNEANKERYSVDGYVMFKDLLGVRGMYDFESFFGYVGQKTGAIKNMDCHDKKGTLRVVEW